MADLSVALGGIAACLVFSAVFSGSETALTSLSRTRAQQLLEQGGSAASILKLWIDRPVDVLTTILIGNNLVNITASALATQAADQLLGQYGGDSPFVSPTAAAVGVMTLLLLTFGEITPKSLAQANYERLALPALRFLHPFLILFGPVTVFFVALSRSLARLTGRELGAANRFVREEDIEYLVQLGRREGSLSEERERLLRSVFEFTDTIAREVMVPRMDVIAVPVGISRNDLVDLILKAGYTRMPVYEGTIDNIVGIFYAKDMLRFSKPDDGSEHFDLRKLLRRPHFVPETKPISELLSELQTHRTHLACVIDEYGGFAGIVSLEDIMEEFFGDIFDEYDSTDDDMSSRLPDGSFRLSARLHLSDVGELLGVPIEDDDEIDTLGGYMAKVLGQVPRRGSTIVAWGHRFIVDEATERRIRWIHALPLDDIGSGSPGEDDGA